MIAFRRFWLPVFSVLCLGLAVGVLYRVIVRQNRSVLVEPPELYFAEEPIEGDPLDFRFQVRNRSGSPITITRAVPSCGCMELKTAGGYPMNSPIHLDAGEVAPFQVAIRTRNRIGNQQFQVKMEYRDDRGSTFPLLATSHVTIRSGWRADPYALTLHDLEPGKETVRFVDIYDALPGNGVAVQDVSESDPSAIQVQLERAPKGGPAADNLFGAGTSLRKRHRLRVTLLPEAESGVIRQATITLAPTEANRPSLTIPVVWSTKPPAYRLSPSGLTLFMAKGGARISREVQCLVATGSNANLRVSAKPDWAEVTIGTLGPEGRRITVAIDPARLKEFRAGEVVLAAGDATEPVARIPIRLLTD